MLKVAAFTGGVNEPCARFRVRQHLKLLEKYDIDMTDLSSSLGTFPPSLKLLRPLWGVANILQHLPKVISSYNYDVSLIQREFLSTFYTLEGLTKKPRVLDVDDAIWVYRDGNAAKRLAKNSSAIMCGNLFLQDWFSQYNSNIKVIPTAVDSEYFKPTEYVERDSIILGWSGLGSGLSYFMDSELDQALKFILRKYKNVSLRIVSDKIIKFDLPAESVKFVKWCPENEVSAIQDIDIGLMPLKDSEFQRGKCSYKMLTYMSCERPVVVSPVGMNADVLKMGNVGFPARNKDEWIATLEYLIESHSIRKEIGLNGREVILSKFDLPVVAKSISEVLRSVK